MAATAIRGAQIQDGTVQRLDLDVATAGKSVVARIVQGTGITLSSTGADSGTGDVTINATGGGGTPGGSTTQVQFNDGGVFGGDAGFLYDKTNDILTLPGNLSTDSKLKIGNIEIQAYALNNCWFGDNMYFDGSSFRHRATGAAGLFYFWGTEGQFRMFASQTAGFAESTSSAQVKINADGSVALGGAMAGSQGIYTGSRLLVSGSSLKVALPQDYVFGWSNTSIDAAAALDTALSRNAAGVVEVNNATPGVYRDLKLRTLLLNPGAAPTGVEGALYGNSTDHKIYYHNGTTFVDLTLGGGSGTVTSFSSGDLAPLFTTSEANPTTTPALSFALSTAAANTVFGNNTGSTAAPAYQSLVNAQLPATLSSKTLDDTNTYTAKDGSFTVENTASVTKKFQFTAANITAGQTRIVGIPDANNNTVIPDTGAANNFLTAISSAGVISKAQPAFSNLSGACTPLQRGEWVNASTTTQNPLAADVYIAGSSCVVGANNWAAGGQYRCRFEIVKTAASTATFALNIRVGTGVVGDTLIVGGNILAQTGVVDSMIIDVCVNIRSIGASATSAGNLLLSHTAANGAGYGLPGPTFVTAMSQVATFNSTTATTIGVSFNGGTSHNGTVTCVQASYMQ